MAQEIGAGGGVGKGGRIVGGGRIGRIAKGKPAVGSIGQADHVHRQRRATRGDAGVEKGVDIVGQDGHVVEGGIGPAGIGSNEREGVGRIAGRQVVKQAEVVGDAVSRHRAAVHLPEVAVGVAQGEVVELRAERRAAGRGVGGKGHHRHRPQGQAAAHGHGVAAVENRQAHCVGGV